MEKNMEKNAYMYMYNVVVNLKQYKSTILKLKT